MHRTTLVAACALLLGCAPSDDTPSARWTLDAGVTVEIPRDTSGLVRLSDSASGMSVGFRPSLPDTEGFDTTSPGQAVALGESTELRLRSLPQGVEDVLLLRGRPRDRVDYEVALNGVAGLRLVDDTLEFLDDRGTPRLRMSRPFIVGAHAQRRGVSVTLTGCRADESAAPPWGRPVTAPGSSNCLVTLDWSHTPVPFPAALDPVWTTTGSMAEARAFHVAGRLPDGRVMVAGGQNLSVALSSSEFWDPSTGTFAQAAPLPRPVMNQRSVVLDDGRILAMGGMGPNGYEKLAVLYEPSEAAWQETASLPDAVAGLTATKLNDGTVLIAGGSGPAPAVDTVARFDPVSESWISGPSLLTARAAHTATLLADGRVLVAGGLAAEAGLLRSCEIYDLTADAWSPASDLNYARMDHVAELLDDGRVLVVGGTDFDSIWEVSNALGGFSVEGALEEIRARDVAVKLGDGRVLLAGGVVHKIPTVRALLFDPGSDEWTYTQNISGGREGATLTLVDNGRALIAGGRDEAVAKYQASAELFGTGLSPGASCSDATQCESLYCVDGVCCAEPCDGECAACSAADKLEGADGVCGERASCFAHCTGPATLFRPDGEQDCAPFVCDTTGRACLSSCTSAAECVGGAVCDAQGRCVTPSAEPPLPEPRCDCGVLGRTRDLAEGLSALVFLALFRMRRRGRAHGKRDAARYQNAPNDNDGTKTTNLP